MFLKRKTKPVQHLDAIVAVHWLGRVMQYHANNKQFSIKHDIPVTEDGVETGT